MLAAACNGVRNIDDATRGAVVVAGNRGGAIRMEGVRQALVVFVVGIKGAAINMIGACVSAPLRPPTSKESSLQMLLLSCNLLQAFLKVFHL